MADSILDSLDYYSLLDAALENKTDAVLSNGRPEHARFIIQRFLEHAKGTVRLFTGQLKRTFNGVQIYEDKTIRKVAKEFLGREGTRLAILLQNDIDVEEGEAENHPLVKDILEAAQRHELKGTLEIRKASDNDVEWLCTSDFPYHWMVMDEEAYRLETECEQAKASVNFGDPKMAEALAKLFDRIFANGRPMMLSSA